MDKIGNLQKLDINFREETRIFNRLRSDYASLNSYLYKINQTDSPNSINCQVIEDREQFTHYRNQKNSCKLQLKNIRIK